jgi:cytochrome c-type biogenesis protein CcmH/NrfG
MTNRDRIEQMEKLMADDPADATGWFLLGRLYMDESEFTKAADAFEKAVAIKPDYSAAWKQLGDAWRRHGENGRALETYQRGLAVAEENRDLQTVKELQVFIRKLSGE